MYRSFLSKEWLDGAQTLSPDAHGDWINQRNDTFAAYIPLEPEKKFTEKGQSFFSAQALGVATNRDAWVYAFTPDTLSQRMRKTIECFNRTLGAAPSLDKHEISWATNLLKAHATGKEQTFSKEKIRLATYRPFQKMWQYFDGLWNERRGVMPKLFPTGERGENVVICTGGLGSPKARTCLITDVTPDLNMMDAGTQCFPLYWYEEKDVDLFGQRTLVKHDGVSDWILDQARRRYHGATVDKEAIFYFVYGALHRPAYRRDFAADLKKSLPRLPLPEAYADFRETARIGQALAALHLNYETLDPYPLEEVGDFSDTRVVKMRFGGKGGKDRSTLVVNGSLTLRGIPEEAYAYQVNGRSPLEWAVDRYQIRTDKASGIVNDPNLWAPGNPRHIPDLLKRLVTLSLESLRLIAQLP